MRQLILISTVVLLTTMASLADELVDKLDFYYPRYHWAGAVKHVIDNPDKAQEFLARLPELVEVEKDNGRRNVLWFYGSFVERVLAVKVRGEESSVERPGTGLDLAQPIDEALTSPSPPGGLTGLLHSPEHRDRIAVDSGIACD